MPSAYSNFVLASPFSDYAYRYDPATYGEAGVVDDGVRGRVIDGKGIAQKLRLTMKETLAAKLDGSLSPKRAPGLSVILVGENPASKVYVGQKHKACEEVGIASTVLQLPADTSVANLLEQIDSLNNDESCDGILVQLPLPTAELQSAQEQVLLRIRPDKDVDGFHPFNLGCLVARAPRLRPCTPWGVMHLLWSTGVNPYGLRCVIVGASNIVGRPMMLELLLNGASVQIAHRFTRDLEGLVREAECLIVAAGKPGLVKGSWIKPGAIVIDVGMNRLETGKLAGDVDFEEARQHAGWITPVPGGVGPMTVAMLLQNTMVAFDMHTREQQ
jgi:methylenetetrahydrofolate dehydrogenase (NADP+)/methenyltetrahydrofolate cyclohydrolase